jgi:hypothetical protein
MHGMRHGTTPQVGVGEMNTLPKGTEPSLWKHEQSDNTKLKRKLESCEEENKSLNKLIHHIGESVIRHVKSKD